MFEADCRNLGVEDYASHHAGVAHHLLNHICELGKHCGLEKLEAEFMAEQTGAMNLFIKFGFIKVATLPQHLIDTHGKEHDYIIMVFNMRDFEVFEAD